MNNKKHQQKLAKRKEHKKKLKLRDKSGYWTYVNKKPKQSPETAAAIAEKLGISDKE